MNNFYYVAGTVPTRGRAPFGVKVSAEQRLSSWPSVYIPDQDMKGQKDPGPRLNIKTVLTTYGDFHVKDKTAVRTSYL